ncbi:unnamed protein product [Linum trigynum]|uniref:Uncharacterized protein n=1 Tax=Linum trigynum TaxID=586398 RepID=A0AAV2E9E1_9ROSI
MKSINHTLVFILLTFFIVTGDGVGSTAAMRTEGGVACLAGKIKVKECDPQVCPLQCQKKYGAVGISGECIGDYCTCYALCQGPPPRGRL